MDTVKESTPIDGVDLNTAAPSARFDQMIEALSGVVVVNETAAIEDDSVKETYSRERALANRTELAVRAMQKTLELPGFTRQILVAENRADYADERSKNAFWGGILTAMESDDWTKKTDPEKWAIGLGTIYGNKREKQIWARVQGIELAEDSLIKVVDRTKRQTVSGSGYYVYRTGPINGIAGGVAAYKTGNRRVSELSNRQPRDRFNARFYGKSPYVEPAELDEMGDNATVGERLIRRVFLVDQLAAMVVAAMVRNGTKDMSRTRAIKLYAPHGMTLKRFNKALENAELFANGVYLNGIKYGNARERIAWYWAETDRHDIANVDEEIAVANRKRIARNLYWANRTKSIIAANERRSAAHWATKARAESHGDMTYTRAAKLEQLAEMETAKRLAFDENKAEITARNERIIGRLVAMNESNRADENAVRRAKAIQRLVREWSYTRRERLHNKGNHLDCAHLMDEN